MKYILNEKIDGIDLEVGQEVDTGALLGITWGNGTVSNPLDIHMAVKAGVLSKKEEEEEVIDDGLGWLPDAEKREAYWYISKNHSGSLVSSDSSWDNDSSDKNRRGEYGVYRTQEEADTVIEKIKAALGR